MNFTFVLPALDSRGSDSAEHGCLSEREEFILLINSAVLNRV